MNKVGVVVKMRVRKVIRNLEKEKSTVTVT